MPDKRPGTWQTWMSVAEEVAKRSRCGRAQVGAVIVDVQDRIIATGYNGPPAGFRVAGDCSNWCKRGEVGPTPETLTSYEDCPTVHAEMNALLYVDRSRCEGGSLFVTGAICFTCAKAVANSGIEQVFMLDVNAAHHRDPGRTITLMRRSGLTVYTCYWDGHDLITDRTLQS